MKKKGLIVATIVMVLVLAVSLSTATYAWFSSQAQATVDDLTITTTAENGLQIAMTNTANSVDGIVSGDLTYNGTTWAGTDGWGTYLGFTAIEVGNINHAATYMAQGSKIQVFNGYKKANSVSGAAFDATTQYYTMTEESGVVVGTTNVVGKYVETSGLWNITTDTTAQEGTTYYTLAEVESSAASSTNFANYYIVSTEEKTLAEADAGFYQPTGYDNKMQPIGYKKVTANQKGTLYHLTMAVTNAKAIGALGMSIEVTPAGTAASLATPAVSESNPGMAAASRIEMDVTKKVGDANKVADAKLAPFSSYKLTNSKTMDSTTTTNGWTEAKDGKANSTGKYTCTIDTKGENASIAVNSVYYINMYIWIEGTDDECCNDTTGTQMTFQIKFTYVDSNKSADDLSYEFTNTTGDADAITLTFA